MEGRLVNIFKNFYLVALQEEKNSYIYEIKS